MSEIKNRIISVSSVCLNTRHLPQNEFDKLDDFMPCPNQHLIYSCIYGAGVLIMTVDFVPDLFPVNDFPVLFEIIKEACEHNIFYIDFYDRGSFIDGLKVYDWGDSLYPINSKL